MNKFILVKKIIDDWDPIDLLSHAPADEYEAEVNDILKVLAKTNSIDELSIEIHKVFVNWFGEDKMLVKKYSIENCKPIAIKIREKIYG